MDVISLDAVLDTMAEGLLVLDAACNIVLWNRALEEMTGWQASEMVGASCSRLICSVQRDGGGRPQPAQSDCALLKHVGGKSAVTHVECALQTRTGETIPVLKNARVLPGADGMPAGAVITLTDLRPLRRLEHDLAVMRRHLQEADSETETGIGRLVGTSVAMRNVYERLRLASDSDATVLILGETGTGKELAAEAIHLGSARANRPFIRVSCAALPETLLESELFGHVRGAFTGADRDKVGRFEAAEGGTLFLDEIGDISPLVQLKLLRVLQEHEFERVGESLPRPADVRVICATNRDLRELVDRGEFREDLFYRIRVFPIDLPPLRDRKADIPRLVATFIERFNHRTGKKIRGVSSEVMRCFMDHCWPGNVRELENAIEHAFVTCQSDIVGLLDIPGEIRQAELRSAYCRNQRKGRSEQEAEYGSASPADTAEGLVALLEQCGWNRSEVARRLGIDRTTVWRKMKQWGIRAPE